MKCNNCGKETNGVDKYCRYCGSIVNRSDNTLAIISVVLGILSITVCVWLLPIGIIGLILGICQKEKSGIKTTGIVLNIIGIVLGILVWVCVSLFSINTKNYFLNEGDNGFVHTIINKFSTFINNRIDNNDWIKYEYLREDANGKETTLTGTWRLLSEEEWNVKVNKDNLCITSNNFEKCSQYKLVDILEDNEDTEFTSVMNTIRTKLIDNDIYVIEIDNILLDDTSVEKLTFLTILIEHKNEGVEAIVVNSEDNNININSNESYSLVKISDESNE